LQLDWAQIVTQIIGFLLALVILKKYAWGPLLALIEERQEKIRKDFSAAEDVRREAEAFKRDLETKLRESDAQARARILEAVNEGQRVATEMREKARVESQALLDKAREEISREQDKARATLREEMVELSLAAAAKLVEKELDATRDREIAREFIADLERIR
jgi:F-type H+-transporting ATPase subunit b